MENNDIHNIVDQRDRDIKAFIKESFEKNNQILVAQFGNLLHERDKDMLGTISDHKNELEIVKEKYNSFRDDFIDESNRNDKFKEEVREEIRILKNVNSNQTGVMDGAKGVGKMVWAFSAFFIGVIATVAAGYIAKP